MNTDGILQLTLPNARAGDSYHEQFRSCQSVPVRIIAVQGLEAAGLRFDPDQEAVLGTPGPAGDYDLEVTCILSDPKIPHPVPSRLSVIPDPRTLWQNIPSETDSIFWKPDADKQCITAANGWCAVAVSQRGRSHAHTGMCREDDAAIFTDPATGWTVMAVSDGAGSAPLSREGSRIAVTESSRVLMQRLREMDARIMEKIPGDTGLEPDPLLRDLLYNVFSMAVYAPVRAIHDLLGKSEGASRRYRDFYATLLLVAHKPVDDGYFTASYWIGDGGIGIYTRGQNVRIPGAADTGEYAGQTRFLDREALEQEDIRGRIVLDLRRDLTALILMTDGITDPVFETEDRLTRLALWDALWEQTLRGKLTSDPEQTANNLLMWLDFWSRGHHDDRTLALLYHPETL